MVQAQPFFEFLAVGRNQVDTKLVRIDEDIAAGVAITLGELGHQLLDARLCHGEDALLVTLLESDFLGERLFEQPLQVRYKRRRLAFASGVHAPRIGSVIVNSHFPAKEAQSPCSLSRESLIQRIEISSFLAASGLSSPCISRNSPCFSEIAGKETGSMRAASTTT